MSDEAATDIFDPPIPEVPEGWGVLDFADAISIMPDQGRKVKKRNYLPEGEYPVIDQGQDPIGGFTSDSEMLYEGQLPVIIFGDHTLAVKYVDKPFAVGADGVKLLRPKGISDEKYLYYLLRSLRIPSRGYSRHFQFLRRFKFPVAPEDQQPRIVAEIEKQLSRLDEAIAGLKRVKANLKRYKAAVLKAAVEGKLTEEWRKQNPDVEPASKLLERILAERRAKWEETELAKMKAKGKEPKNDKWKEKYKEPSTVEPKELENLPEGYIVVPLDALCSQIGDVDHKMPKKQEKGIPYISTKDFLDNGDIDFDKAKLIREEDYLHLCRKIYPEQNDVLLSRYGTVGEVRLVTTDREFQASYSVAIIKPVVTEISGYLTMVLQTHPLQKQIKKHTRSTAQPDLGLGHIREFEVPIPPLGEQEKIMEEVDDRVSLFNRLENEIDLATIKASNARQSVLTRAFNGLLNDVGRG